MEKTEEITDLKQILEYYNLMLKIMNTPFGETYILSDEEKNLLINEQIYNKIIINSITMAISENYEKIPVENIQNKKNVLDFLEEWLDFRKSLSDTDKLREIRNCIDHIDYKCVNNEIVFDNSNVKGSVPIELFGEIVCALYGISGDNYEKGTKDALIYCRAIPIKSYDDFSKFLQEIKIIEYFGDGDRTYFFEERREALRSAIYYISEYLNKKNISAMGLNKKQWEDLIHIYFQSMEIKNILDLDFKFKVNDINSYPRLRKELNDYFMWIGSEKFFDKDQNEQESILTTYIKYYHHKHENVAPMHYISKIKQFVLDNGDKNEIELEKIDANYKYWYTTDDEKETKVKMEDYKPIFYIDTTLSQFSYVFGFIKELQDKSKIDESVLDYSQIDLGGLKSKYKKVFKSSKYKIEYLKNIKDKMEKSKKNTQEIDSIEKRKIKKYQAKIKNPYLIDKRNSLEQELEMVKEGFNKKRKINENKINEFKSVLEGKKEMTNQEFFRHIRNSIYHNNFEIDMGFALKKNDFSKMKIKFWDIEKDENGNETKVFETEYIAFYQIQNIIMQIYEQIQENYDKIQQEEMNER